MAELQEYKCPCCGGAIEFNSSIQKMKCPYCDTEFEMETLLAFDKELSDDGKDDFNWTTSSTNVWSESETNGLREYVCKSCGGVIVGDENMAATACPYCDNPVVVMGQFCGDLKPDYVIPFQLDKNSAKEALKKHLLGKRLLPKVFKSENHIDEIKGIYVPFWLFDSKAKARVRYKGVRTKCWSDRDYNYKKDDFYSILRAGDIAFDHVPVDGSSKMADDLMESIEPFDFSKAVDFQTAYLAGYFADKYDVSRDESIGRANERIRNSTDRAFRDTIHGFSCVTCEDSSVRLIDGKSSYALYPVWILNTHWQDKNYMFAMNGQTGKFVGDLPMDKAAFKRMLFGIWGISSAAIFAALSFLWLI